MAIAKVVSFGAASTNSNAVTSSAVDTSGANFLGLITSMFNTTENVSDSKGNTWSYLTVQTTISGLLRCRIAYVVNPTVGSGHTVSLGSNGTFPAFAGAAFSTVNTTSPFDQQNGAEAPGPDTGQPGSITPTEDDELILTGFTNAGTATPTIDSGFTVDGFFPWTSGQCDTVAFSFLIQGAAAAVNPTWSQVSGGNKAIVIGSFKKAAASGGFFAPYYYDVGNQG